MNWIEQLCGIAPDAGNGGVELLYFANVAIVAAIFFGRRILRGNAGQ